MKIELKNIKHIASMSEETACFTADVYINDVKTAYAQNRGHGGCTSISAYDQILLKTLKAAEEYAESLPAIDLGDGFIVKSTLDGIIDNIVDDFVNSKQLRRDEKKGIAIKTQSGYEVIAWKAHTIEKFLSTEGGTNFLKSEINKLLAEGKTILNTNLPAEMLTK